MCIYIYVKIPTGEISPLKVQSNSPSSHNFRQFIDEKTIKIIQISKDFQRYISLEESSPLCLNDRKINWGVIHKSYIYTYIIEENAPVSTSKLSPLNFPLIPEKKSSQLVKAGGLIFPSKKMVGHKTGEASLKGAKMAAIRPWRSLHLNSMNNSTHWWIEPRKTKKTVSIIVTGLLTGIPLYIMVYYNPLITG